MSHPEAETEADGGSWLGSIAPETELGRLIATHDWASTSLGPPAAWPEPLRTMVRVCLTSRFPMLIVWGPDLIKIYNDGYRDFLGSDKHPGALGTPAALVWPELWDTLAPLFESVMRTGEGVWGEHERFVMERNGYPEETFFTFAYSPIHQPDGTVGGVLDVSSETTAHVVLERRLRCVGDLAGALVSAEDEAEVCSLAVEALGRSPATLPSAKIRLWLGDQLVPVATNDRRLIHTEDEVAQIAGLAPDDEMILDHDWTPGRPAHKVAVGIGDDEARGVLTVTLNPERPFDEGYRSFLALVGRTIGTALANAYRRSVELGEQRRISDTLQLAMLPRISDRDGFAARYVPAVGTLSVGGDWYDVVDVDDTHTGLVVGDCVGHGLEAAAAMSQLRGVSRALLLEGRSPHEVVEAMDRMAATVDGAFAATMVCAVIDQQAQTMTYSAAGHPPPLLVSRGVGRWLEGARGMPLAISRDGRAEASVDLRPDDLLVLYTDGLVEVRGESIDDGLERLRAEAEATAGADLAELADGLVDALVATRPRDDVALIVARIS